MHEDEGMLAGANGDLIENVRVISVQRLTVGPAVVVS